MKMQVEIDKVITAQNYRLKESNKIFSAMDDAETNIMAKLHLRKTITENESIIAAGAAALVWWEERKKVEAQKV